MTALYRQPRKPFELRELRLKSWKTLEANIAQDDRRWAQRCEQYWRLQERLYGIKMSDYTMMIDNNEGFVSTAAVIVEILPGERTADFSRVPVEAAGVQSLMLQ